MQTYNIQRIHANIHTTYTHTCTCARACMQSRRTHANIKLLKQIHAHRSYIKKTLVLRNSKWRGHSSSQLTLVANSSMSFIDQVGFQNPLQLLNTLPMWQLLLAASLMAHPRVVKHILWFLRLLVKRIRIHWK